jgi:hypothetical protein
VFVAFGAEVEVGFDLRVGHSGWRLLLRRHAQALTSQDRVVHRVVPRCGLLEQAFDLLVDEPGVCPIRSMTPIRMKCRSMGPVVQFMW